MKKKNRKERKRKRKRKRKEKMSSSLSAIGMLNDANLQRMSAVMAIDASICSALMQPPFPFPIETFEEYREEFKATAIIWSNRTRRALYQLNSDIISFCDMYNAFYPRLTLYGSRFNDKDKTKNEKARNRFTDLWKSLLEEVKSSKATSDASVDELSKFMKRLETDRSNFQNMSDGMTTKHTKDEKDHLKRDRELIVAQKTAMGNAMMIIASGAMLNDLGLLIIVGSLSAIEWGGDKFPVVGSGLKVAKKGLLFICFFVLIFDFLIFDFLLTHTFFVLTGCPEEVSQAAKDFNKTSKACAEYITKSRAVSDRYTDLNHVITDIDRLMVLTEDTLRVTEIMHSLFASLESGFGRVLQLLDFNFPPEIILETVNNGKEDCESVSKAANAIQNTLLYLKIDSSRLQSGDYPKIKNGKERKGGKEKKGKKKRRNT